MEAVDSEVSRALWEPSYFFVRKYLSLPDLNIILISDMDSFLQFQTAYGLKFPRGDTKHDS